MSVRFNCTPTGTVYGTPQEAAACRCPSPWREDDTCVRCGRLLGRVIRQTFHDQAKKDLWRADPPRRSPINRRETLKKGRQSWASG